MYEVGDSQKSRSFVEKYQNPSRKCIKKILVQIKSSQKQISFSQALNHNIAIFLRTFIDYTFMMKQEPSQKIPKLSQIFPSLLQNTSKGDNGCIGVIGGSYQYTGAPFYAAMTALKAGADLAHIFCARSAATPIKSYSPEIIVHPVFSSSYEFQQELSQENIEKLHGKWLNYLGKFWNKINSWVIGPGLGRDELLVNFFPKLIRSFPKGTFVTLDADGLYMLCQHPQLLGTLKQLKCVATPNKRQFKHLNHLLNIDISNHPDSEQAVKSQLEQRKQQKLYATQIGLEGFHLEVTPTKITSLPLVVVRKGETDEIYTKDGRKFVVFGEGSRKRCGGIGDVLAGCMGVFTFWSYEFGPILACRVSRIAAQLAFQEQGRSLTAPKIIDCVAKVVQKYP